MQVSLIALGAALLLTGPQQGSASEGPNEPHKIRRCTITLIEDVRIPAEEAGKLVAWQTPVLDANGSPVVRQGQPAYQEVREGLEVSQGQLLGQIDDRMEEKLKKVAEYKLAVAEKEAGNDVSVRYARAAKDVASAELDQVKQANDRHPGSVALSEVRRLALALRQAELQIEQSQHDLDINKVSVSVREAELEVADMQLDRRRIVAPFDGIIVERYVDVGEWVRPGDPVLRIVRINRVRIKASVNATEVLPSEVTGQRVTVKLPADGSVPVPQGAAEQPVQGQVVFVSPLVDADGRFDVWAEVDNVWLAPDRSRPSEGYWLLRPGLTVEMDVALKGARRTTQTVSTGSP